MVRIKVATVANYRPSETHDDKVKKSDHDMPISLTGTDDILGHLLKIK